MTDIMARLQNAMHEESAMHSPRTTAAIEAMRDAITEIGRLRAIENELRVEIERLQATIARLRARVELADK